MPQFRNDIVQIAGLADVYADASPDLWGGLESAVSTARTLNDGRGDVDAALMAAIGFGDTAADRLERAGPYLVRVAADLVPTTKLLDDYRGMILCTHPQLSRRRAAGRKIARRRQRILAGGVRNDPRARATRTSIPTTCRGSTPMADPRDGPGCWQKVTLELCPFPYLVMDTGFSIAPYNHVELGQPMCIEYVWGRQVGEPTINP